MRVAEDQPIGREALRRLQDRLTGFITKRRNEIGPGMQRPFADVSGELESALSALQFFEPASRHEEPIVVVRKRLLMLPLVATVRSQIGEVCRSLVITEADVKNYHFEQGVEATGWCHYKGGGSSFLRSIFQNGKRKIRDAVDDHVGQELLRLSQEVVSHFGDSYGACVHLLFHCLSGDIRTVRNIVETQITSYEQTKRTSKKPHQAEPVHFFHHLLEFLGVYSEVTEYLVQNSRHSENIVRRSEALLERLFRDEHLQQVRKVPMPDGVNLFNLLREYFTHDPDKADADTLCPWVVGDLEKTPFDPGKIGTLIAPEVPRQVLAHVLLELNDHSRFQLVRELKVVLGQYDSTVARGGKLDQIEHQIDDLAANLKLRIMTLLPLDEKVQLARKQIRSIQDPLDPFAIEGQNPGDPLVSPRRVLLRVINPRSITESREGQHEWGKLVGEVGRPTPSLKEQEMLGRSLECALNSDDPFLEEPLEGRAGRSMREDLVKVALDRFSQDQILYGLTGKPDDRTLIPMVDAEKLDKSPAELRRYFDTAGVGVLRGRLLEVAKAMDSHLSFSELMRFANEQVLVYLGARQNVMETSAEGPAKRLSQYRCCFYASATEAWRHFIMHCFHILNPGDHVVIGHQEYDTVTHPFTSRLGDGGVRVIHTNREKSGGSKTVDELFSEMQAGIDSTHSRMVILSSKTRLGDAPCSYGSKRNGRHLAELIRRLHEAYSHIPIAIDACQEVGRSVPEPLIHLGADIVLGSGAKALGVGPAAFALYRPGYLEQLRTRGIDFKYDPSYLSIQHVTALGLAMKALRSTEDFFRPKGNWEPQRRVRLDHKIERHMVEITQCILEQVEGYGRSFVNGLVSLDATSVKDDNRGAWEDQMGCRVHAPGHRNPQDYTGIVTIWFPNISGRVLARRLAEQGFVVRSCGYKERAIRISCHYLHNRQDIVTLFQAIAEIHRAEVIEQLTNPKPEGKPLRCIRSLDEQ